MAQLRLSLTGFGWKSLIHTGLISSIKQYSLHDDSHNYILQREVIFANLLQRRIRLTLPGNFSIASGNNAELEIPNRFIEQGVEGVDETLSGKYIITGVRHIIRFDKHETVIEVATDSTKKKS